MTDKSELQGHSTSDFVRLLKQHDRRISSFIFALVSNWSDAEDLIQETSVRLWEQFHEYRPGADFGAWACTIARYMVMAYRKKQQRNRLQLSPEVIEKVASELDSAAAEQSDRLRALGSCLQKCDAGSRNLLRLCYRKNAQIKNVAERMGRSITGVYMALSRLRRALYDCVENELRRSSAE
jgi:RNA polymerase sigma-70 factor (ECF subfamily)